MSGHLHLLAPALAGIAGLLLATLLLGHGIVLLLVLFGLYLLLRRRRSGPAVALPGPIVPAGPPVELGPADRDAFTGLVRAVQRAWTAADLGTLGQLATPPMTSRFADQLADLARRGARNIVSEFRIDDARVLASWGERDADYARVLFGTSMVDVTVDGTGRIVDGAPNEHVSLREHWVFRRRRGEGWRVHAVEPE